MSDLDDYLDGEVREAQLDSHGTFTLSLPEALKKFGSYGSQTSSGFILKLVQAACILGAERIRVSEPPSRLVIQVEMAAGQLDFQELLNNFEKHLLGSSASWQSYLCRALLGASAEFERPSYLAVWETNAFVRPVVFPSANQASVKLSACDGMKSGFTWQMETPPDWVLEFDELLDRLRFCPMPVLFQQRIIRDLNVPSDFRVKGWNLACEFGAYSCNPLVGQMLADLYCWEGVSQPPAMMLRPACGPTNTQTMTWPRIGNSQALNWLRAQAPKLTDVPFRGAMTETGDPPETMQLKANLSSRGKSFLSVDMTTAAGSLQAAFMTAAGDRLTPVVWGVALEPVQGCWKCSGLEVVASLVEMPTDLTGERLVNGPELAEWVRNKRRQLADWLDLPLACVEPMSNGRMPSHAATAIGATLGGLGAVVCGAPMLAGHSAFLGALVGYGVRELQKSTHQRQPNPELCRYFHSSLGEIQRQLRREK